MSLASVKKTLRVDSKAYTYYALETLGDVSHLPFSLKILLENLLRHFDGKRVTRADLDAVINSVNVGAALTEISFYPARILMQDFTGVPAIVDLAAMRDAMMKEGKDPTKVNPLIPVDLVIDHSIMVDKFGTKTAFADNVQLEYQRNLERYAFLSWGQRAFNNFRVVPPGTGICHQVNLEYLAKVVWCANEDGETLVYPDTVLGTDSHTTMVNGLGVLGWGVGGIEAEAAMLGQPQTMLIPEVVGVRLEGTLKEGITATDLVLTITHLLRAKGVVGKFVEFYGSGLKELSLADRATIANMAPEYGATCGFFPTDSETIKYLKLTNRSPEQVELVENYAKVQGLWNEGSEPTFKDILQIDLATIYPSIAGPKRPQDKLLLSDLKKAALDMAQLSKGVEVSGKNFVLNHHDVVIAAITSCTNTSNPSVMIGAGLLARKARSLGLEVKPWVKTSLAPGSQVVREYLEASDLMKDLEGLGFHVVGYGCTTCIGNSGPLDAAITQAIDDNHLIVSSVLSGNRNFEGRINPHAKANYLMSPPLVVAFALAGTTAIDFEKDPIGKNTKGEDVFLKDIWPSTKEIQDVIQQVMTSEIFAKRYRTVFEGDEFWKKVSMEASTVYKWGESTYIKHPPYFGMEAKAIDDIADARILALLGDSITTDHISPAGSIKENSPAGAYLQSQKVSMTDFNSYGARRGNHEVMVRGTFSNIRLQNEMLPGISGGYTKFEGTQMSIFDAAQAYMQEETPLVIVAGKEYGTGSSRDWAAKGTRLLGVRAVIAESFERIHRSNLVGMGVLPLEFMPGTTRKTLHLDGSEQINIEGLAKGIFPKMVVQVTFKGEREEQVPVLVRIDTEDEMQYFLSGGILPFVFNVLAA
ncbi:MAG: aconitate hydratase AcnA [Pseudomonadota bacterium]|jgi:aconitate hydratase|nr:aconitate hydratase AcnA [Alphaproteobacteria bacterium]